MSLRVLFANASGRVRILREEVFPSFTAALAAGFVCEVQS